MPRVFIPQIPQRWDGQKQEMVPTFATLDQAKEFGDLVTLLDRNDDVWKPDAIITKLESQLSDFCDDDYFLPMGSYHFMMWAFTVAFNAVDKHIQTLQWHQREGKYRVITTKVF